MKIFRLPHYKDEELMMAVIADLEMRDLPNIGIFETRTLTRGEPRKQQITSLSLMPEDFHATVRWTTRDDKPAIGVDFYRQNLPNPKLELLMRWWVDVEETSPIMGPVTETASVVAQLFFHGRDAFDDPKFIEHWDTKVYPEFGGTDASAVRFLAEIKRVAQEAADSQEKP